MVINQPPFQGEFTYYGDLLGVSNYYALGADIAYKKLNNFYNITFNTLRPFCDRHIGNVNIDMFSDSLLIRGCIDASELLGELQNLYLNLIEKDILLRGALVKGRLEWDVRITLENFHKSLPRDDYLAKSMSLQKGFSGARLLIDNQLARDIFRHNNCQDWATFEGYANSIARDVPLDSPIRRICPVPSGQLYEFLYFWLTDQQQYNIPAIREKLTHTSTMTNSEINKHYSDTLCLLERSVEQRNYSENLIFPRNNH